MHYLVTGGAGFIGTNICERLIKDGHTVIVIDNLSVSDTNVAGLQSLGVTVVVKDISSYEEIFPFFSNVDTVIHLAAMNRAQRSIENPLEANAVNITGTLNCLEAARQNNVKRFINISSSSVYASQRDILLEEDMPLAPPHPYGAGKLAGEHYARIYNEVYGLETVSLRFFSVFGPKQLGTIDKAGVVAKFIHHAVQGMPIEIYGDGKQLRNFSYVSDVVECVMRASVSDASVGQVINVASSKEISVGTLAEIVQHVTKCDLDIIYSDPLIGDPARNPANTEKCQRLLDYVPVTTFEDGITNTYRWYQSAQF